MTTSTPGKQVGRADAMPENPALAADAVSSGTPSFASRSLPAHLARGTIGFGSVAAAIALAPVIGWAGLLLLPVGVVALRGCPVCWTIGLVQTISRGRLRRQCVDGSCRLTASGPPLT